MQKDKLLKLLVMFTLIKKCSKHALVGASADVYCVTVSLTPQSQPLELFFLTSDDAMAFVNRVHQDDGEQYVVSLLSYHAKANNSLE